MTDDWKLPWDGGCLCGGVRLRISAAAADHRMPLLLVSEAQRERLFPGHVRAGRRLRRDKRGA